MATFSPFQTVGGGTASSGRIALRAKRLRNQRTCGARREGHHVTRFTERLDSHCVRRLSASLAMNERDEAVVSELRRQAASDLPADIAGVLNQAKQSFRFAYLGLA